MAKLRDRDLASSLFPFLSVLACVIGTLALLIASLAMNQVAEGLRALDPEAPAPPELETQRAAVRALEHKLAAARDVGAERAALQAELRALGIAPSTAAARQHVAARLSSAQLARRLEALQREARELDDALVGISRALERPLDRGEAGTIRIHPQGRGEALRPFFVECRSEGLRIYYEDLDDSLFLDRKSVRGQSQFEVFLRRARSIGNHTVVFLIRPDGVETYDWAVVTATNMSVRHAKLPLPGPGAIEFAL
jgi:hypothetical protein